MPKRRFTEEDWKSDASFHALCTALAACKDKGEVAALLRDIGTLAELKAWSERLQVAKQLKEGRTYRTIASMTGASTTTVTRVANFLQDGEGGYRRVLKNHHHHALSPRGEKMVSNA